MFNCRCAQSWPATAHRRHGTGQSQFVEEWPHRQACSRHPSLVGLASSVDNSNEHSPPQFLGYTVRLMHSSNKHFKARAKVLPFVQLRGLHSLTGSFLFDSRHFGVLRSPLCWVASENEEQRPLIRHVELICRRSSIPVICSHLSSDVGIRCA